MRRRLRRRAVEPAGPQPIFPGADSVIDAPPTFLPEAETPLAPGTFSGRQFRKWRRSLLSGHGASCLTRPGTLPD